jgi:hypothetical protein
METVVALGVLAVAVPLVLAAMGASLEARRDAEVDTRAALIARSLTADMRQAYAGDGRIFHQVGDALHPRVPVAPGDDPVRLAFDGAGAFVRCVNGEEYATGLAAEGFGFLVEIKCLAQAREEPLARLQMQVESPAPAAAAHRHKLRFVVQIATPADPHEN